MKRYLPKSRIREDHQSTTFEAWDTILSRPVHLKTQRPELEPAESERFQQKYRRFATLAHPNLIEIYDFDISDGSFSVVTEKLAGESLKSICRDGLISEEDFRRLVEQTLSWAISWEESGNGDVIVRLNDIHVSRSADDLFQFTVCDIELVEKSTGKKRENKTNQVQPSSDLLESLAQLYFQALGGGYLALELSDDKGNPGDDRLTFLKQWMRKRRPDVSPLSTNWLCWLIVRIEERTPLTARESITKFERAGKSGSLVPNLSLRESSIQNSADDLDDEDDTAPIPLHLLEDEDAGEEEFVPVFKATETTDILSLVESSIQSSADDLDDEDDTAPIPLHLLEEETIGKEEFVPVFAASETTDILPFGESLIRNQPVRFSVPFEPIRKIPRTRIAGIGAAAAALIAALITLPIVLSDRDKSPDNSSLASAPVTGVPVPPAQPEVTTPEESDVANLEVELNPERSQVQSSNTLADTSNGTTGPEVSNRIDKPADRIPEPFSPARTERSAPQEPTPLVRTLKPRAPKLTPAESAAAEIATIAAALRNEETTDGDARKEFVERIQSLNELAIGVSEFPAQELDALLPALIGENRTELKNTEIALLENAATRFKSVNAARLLANHYRSMDDNAAALPWLVAAANGNDVDAMVEAGLLLLAKTDTREKQREGFALLRKAADSGDRDATYLVGECLLLGKGTSKNEVEAVHYLSTGAELADPRALDLLGVCHADGLGVEVDFDKAVNFFQRAGDLGNLSALANLAVIYLNGEAGEKENDTKAITLLEKGAAKENANCLFLLGQCREAGIGSDIDIDSARKLYERAAKAGSKPANERLKMLSQN